MLRFWLQHLLDKCFAYQLKKKKTKADLFIMYVCKWLLSQPPIKVKLEVLLHPKKGEVKLEVKILVVNVFWIPMGHGMWNDKRPYLCSRKRKITFLKHMYYRVVTIGFLQCAVVLGTFASQQIFWMLWSGIELLYNIPHNTISLQWSYLRSVICNNMDTKLEQVKIISRWELGSAMLS